jgi:hypothetical protein
MVLGSRGGSVLELELELELVLVLHLVEGQCTDQNFHKPGLTAEPACTCATTAI